MNRESTSFIIAFLLLSSNFSSLFFLRFNRNSVLYYYTKADIFLCYNLVSDLDSFSRIFCFASWRFLLCFEAEKDFLEPFINGRFLTYLPEIFITKFKKSKISKNDIFYFYKNALILLFYILNLLTLRLVIF